MVSDRDSCDPVVWLNGKPGDQETQDKPVLALTWPYASAYTRLVCRLAIPAIPSFLDGGEIRVVERSAEPKHHFEIRTSALQTG
jgi:hypothetical protein